MDQLASILVLRAHVADPPRGGTSRPRFARELETELARLGWTVSAPLWQAISQIPKAQAVGWADWLMATVTADVGGDRAWVPLYRRFPHSSPQHTDALYVERMLAHLFQEEDVACVLCGAAGTVRPVRPCGHLVCRACFTPSDYSACPICNRRLNPTDPYLVVPEPHPSDERTGHPLRLRRLDLSLSPTADAIALRDSLTGRLAPLSVDERRDLEVLIAATTAPGDLAWLSDDVPARETKAIVTAYALRTAPTDLRTTTIDAVATRWQTATDIARTLWTLSGGTPGLHVPRRVDPEGRPFERWRPRGEAVVTAEMPRVVPLSRALRRAVLERLDELPMPTVIEDVLRHPTVWKRIAERLHPFEWSERYPRASLVFTVLRDARHPIGTASAAAVLAGEREGWVTVIRESSATGEQVGARARTFGSQVEEALRDGDARGALELLGRRPGELIRRLDHLARSWTGDPHPLVEAARAAAAEASPKVGLSAMASLRARDRIVARAQASTAVAAQRQSASDAHASTAGAPAAAGESPAAPGGAPERAPRVFFPKGGAAMVWSGPDHRPLLPADLLEALRSALDVGLVERARAGAAYDLAIVDCRLQDVPLPSGTQQASGASRALPRGTLLRHPDVPILRLFLHWVQPPGMRVDLDLSVLLFGERWRRLDHCDYTRLRSPLGAVHSGDLTSAPAPLGATEFLDLDLEALRANGVGWVVPVVFSYNDVPFERLREAIAGVGAPSDGPVFDPARVLVRYDLIGDSRASIPFIANIIDGSLRWVDQHLPSSGYAHSVGTRGDALAHTMADLESLYAGASRPTAYDLALVHARGRAREIVVADGSGYADLDGTAVPAPSVAGRRVLAVTVGGPPELAEADAGSTAYSVLHAGEGSVRPISDLLDELD